MTATKNQIRFLRQIITAGAFSEKRIEEVEAWLLTEKATKVNVSKLISKCWKISKEAGYVPSKNQAPVLFNANGLAIKDTKTGETFNQEPKPIIAA